MITFAKIRLVQVVCVATIVLGGASAYADFTISKPTEMGPPIWYPGDDPQGCCFSRDGLELYFSSGRPGGYGGPFDLWVATRKTVDAPWTEPVNLGPNVNGSAGEVYPAISPDGLELYFNLYFDRPRRILRCSRPSKDAPWSKPEVVFPSMGASDTWTPEVSADGLSLYMTSGPGGAWDISVATRPTTEDNWGTPVNLGPSVNSAYAEGTPSISSDGLVLFFMSDRPGGYGAEDIWVTTRSTTDAEWGPPVNYPSLNQARGDWEPAISPDGSVLYFESIFTRWQSTITPIVDFNGDGIVDSADVSLMIDYWGTNEPLYDIGPMPWGDGIVDVQDLIVLSEHLFEEAGLVAYWKLDEPEGSIALDSAAEHDGELFGEPHWQPDGGVVDGALQFDGIDDYASTDPVLNPADGNFSVLAWIKGGAPGQVVLSQMDAANWLAIGSEGNLVTELKSNGRLGGILQSQTLITDGKWHRIGLVWSGSLRSLYVDDIVIAEDIQGALPSSDNGLYLSADSTLTPGTFFSGLIDDVKIYDRVIAP